MNPVVHRICQYILLGHQLSLCSGKQDITNMNFLETLILSTKKVRIFYPENCDFEYNKTHKSIAGCCLAVATKTHRNSH